MAWRGTSVVLMKALLLGLWCCGTAAGAEESRFAMTHSRSQYVHWIDLYDATDTKIDPSDPHAPPYSPVFTCGRCHDYEAIAHGYHFNAMQKLADCGAAGRGLDLDRHRARARRSRSRIAVGPARTIRVNWASACGISC